MPCLVSEIITDVIIELSQVPGVSTQIYATTRISQHVQDAIIFMMDAMWWPDLMKFYPVTLDGVTGEITSDLLCGLRNHAISRYQDIEAVYRAGSNHPLAELPPRTNPYNLSGSSAMYLTPNPATPLRPFTVWPLTAAENLVVHARAYPIIPISTTDTVYLDRLMITYMAANFFAEDDGTNPGQIAKFAGKFEKRLEQVKAAWGQHSIALDPRFNNNEDLWTER